MLVIVCRMDVCYRWKISIFLLVNIIFPYFVITTLADTLVGYNTIF